MLGEEAGVCARLVLGGAKHDDLATTSLLSKWLGLFLWETFLINLCFYRSIIPTCIAVRETFNIIPYKAHRYLPQGYVCREKTSKWLNIFPK